MSGGSFDYLYQKIGNYDGLPKHMVKKWPTGFGRASSFC